MVIKCQKGHKFQQGKQMDRWTDKWTNRQTWSYIELLKAAKKEVTAADFQSDLLVADYCVSYYTVADYCVSYYTVADYFVSYYTSLIFIMPIELYFTSAFQKYMTHCVFGKMFVT